MNHRDVIYHELAVEFLQTLFPAADVISASMQATIEDGILVLPEIYVYFDQMPARAEQRISESIDQFIKDVAAQEGATYRKTLKRIVVDDVDSLDDLLDQPFNKFY